MFTLHNILEPPSFESHLENREVIALFVSFRAFIAPESPMSIDGCGVLSILRASHSLVAQSRSLCPPPPSDKFRCNEKHLYLVSGDSDESAGSSVVASCYSQSRDVHNGCSTTGCRLRMSCSVRK